MDDLVKKEINKTAKKSGGSFALWGIGALLICCGGPIVLLALLAGGTVGILGFLSSNLFLISVVIIIAILVIFWLAIKMKSE